jgi:hypothetical protein
MASRSHWQTTRIVICTAYVLLPVCFGIFCAWGLLVEGVEPQYSAGLILVTILGIMPGLPLAGSQLFAVFRHSRLSARLISWAFWAFSIMPILGVLNLAIVGSDEGHSFHLVPDGLVLLGFLAMNVMTALTMGQLARDSEKARQLSDSASAI